MRVPGELKSAKSRRRLRKIASSITIKVAAAAVNYGSLVFAARLLGAEDFGTLSFVLALVLFLGTFANGGIQITALRYVNQYQATGDLPRERGIIDAALKNSWKGAILVTVAAVAVIFAAWLMGFLDDPTALAIGMLLIPGFSVIDTVSAIARSYGSIYIALIPRDIIWRLLFFPAALLAITLATGPDLRLEIFIGSIVISIFAIIAWQSQALRRMYRGKLGATTATFEIAEWRRVALPLWATSLAAAAIRSIDVIFLGFVLEPAVLGGYFAASRTALLLTFIQASLNVLVGPQISRSYHSRDGVGLQQVLRGAAFLSFAPALALFVIYGFFGRQILSVFASSYADYWLVLMILSFGQLIATFAGSTGLLMNLSGNERQSLKYLIMISIPGIVVMMVCGALIGPVGAAIGLAGWQTVRNLVLVFHSRWYIGFDPSVLSFALPKPKGFEPASD